MPVVEVRYRQKTKPESTFLRNFRRNVTSEMGEDGIIEKLFDLVGVESGWCVEFGAGDGYSSSNSWNLIANHGWRGVLIEGLDSRFKALVNRHASHPGVYPLNAYVMADGASSLDSILAQTLLPTHFDFMSIDIDGNDWHVWKALLNYSPRVVLVEFNPSIPNDVVFVQDYDATVNQGASLLAFIELAKEKGYELAATTDYNAFFVANNLFPLLKIPDNDIDAMHDPGDQETKIFQLFDGSLCLAGCKRLMWHSVDFDSQDIQILPASMRRYPG
ncbi:conserved hypothetical protein [Rhodospirillaceae bacterium LM-1]|nr:conserved hypothetical protein [Rhodospirillaceae bacterium LM-1]